MNSEINIVDILKSLKDEINLLDDLMVASDGNGASILAAILREQKNSLERVLDRLENRTSFKYDWKRQGVVRYGKKK